MRRVTIMFIPDGKAGSRQVRLPLFILRALVATLLIGASALTFLVCDYAQLRHLRRSYLVILQENKTLKGEAKLLMANLEDVKTSLKRVQDYSNKLTEITSLRTQHFAKQTGIGPLTPKEFATASAQAKTNASEESSKPRIPLGIQIEQLTFKPVFNRLASISDVAKHSALELQSLLTVLSQQRSLLSSVPTSNPVDGWITSGFGSRTSPFTGELSSHKGLDIASPPGSPIFAPADGVVIFSGKKDGFGNFVMIAHGYGVVSAYGHNQENLVIVGQSIKRGDKIGTVGQTGRTTGPHLHYEIWVNGRVVDPKKFMLDVEMDEVTL